MSKAGPALLRTTLVLAGDRHRPVAGTQLAKIYYRQMVERGGEHLKACRVSLRFRPRPAGTVSGRGATVVAVAGTRGDIAAGTTGQLLLRWQVRAAPRAASAANAPAPCPGLVIEHVDGAGGCELGSRCPADVDAHDAGMLCPGPEDGCAHCRSVFRRCDAPVIEHAPGDGTGPLVCALGHDADDLDSTEDTDRAGQRVYHPGHDTYPCAIPNCPRCADALSGPSFV